MTTTAPPESTMPSLFFFFFVFFLSYGTKSIFVTQGNYYDHQFLFDNSTVSIDGIYLKYPFQTINTTIITTIIVMLFNFGVIHLIKKKSAK